MARQWRIQFEGAVYHIMSRGVGRGKIFLDEKEIQEYTFCTCIQILVMQKLAGYSE